MAFATIKRGSSPNGVFIISKEDSPFFISNSQLVKWDLAEGQELDEEQYQQVLQLKRQSDCVDKALLFLSIREHTALELTRKLQAKGFSMEEITNTVRQLQSDGSLDEKRYCEALIHSRQRKNPEGKVLLMQRLLSKGVSRQNAQDAIENAFEENPGQYVRQAYLQVSKTTTDPQKIILKLQRKGFSYSEIKKCMNHNE
ncbi:MAG: regulatory protein RecX [Sphaerochaetaceae bacterium]